jgi:DNA-directed RNA polymerase subunit RPC12/RpoP
MIVDTLQDREAPGAAARGPSSAPAPPAASSPPTGSPPAAARAKGNAALAYGAPCPECGGSLRIRDGERSIRCGYCGSALLITTPRGTRSFYLEPKITDGKARLLAIHHVEESTSSRITPRNAAIIDMQLVHVPFWRMRGRLMGWVSGQRTRLDRTPLPDEEMRLDAAYAPMAEEPASYARLVFKRVDWSTPACALPTLGLQGISLRTDFLEWEALDGARRRERDVVLPTRREAETRRDALSYLTHLVVPAGTSAAASRFHLFDSSFSLYYYPVYFLRYVHRGRIYAITVDGASGAILRGDVPAERRIEAKRLFFTPAVFAFLAVTWLPLVLIGAAALYAYDSIEAGAPPAPHQWLAARLGALLGGNG